MNPVVLTEYRTTTGVELTADQRDVLRQLVPGLLVQPTRGKDNLFDLTPGGTVGIVTIDGTVFELRPKIPVDRLLFLVSYAVDPSKWGPDVVPAEDDTDVVEAVAPVFAHHVRTALQRGLLQGYRTMDDSITTVRGRIRIDEQLNRRFGIAPPVEVRFDEFTVDVIENRLLRAALHRLRRNGVRSPALAGTLRRLEAELVNVTLEDFHSRRVPAVLYTRLNDHYRPAVELARLILSSSSLELTSGASSGTAVLLDMPTVFENFVHAALREELKGSESTFPQGANNRPLFLDAARKIRLRPDLSWWDGHRCTFVGDVKYKRTDDAVNHPDLYQLLSYVTATSLPSGLLIYAAGEAEPTTHLVGSPPSELVVRTLQVDGPPASVLRSVGRVAEVVRELRSRGRDVGQLIQGASRGLRAVI